MPKIYLYCYESGFPNLLICAALTADGEALAEHWSSDEDWSQSDMQSPAKYEAYARRYPDGYELVWLGYRPNLSAYPEFARALRINQKGVSA